YLSVSFGSLEFFIFLNLSLSLQDFILSFVNYFFMN
ncbi:putative membrane protein, partial [Bacteroides ovatus str. 3725 D1 iv]